MRDPPGNYGFSCSINISKTSKPPHPALLQLPYLLLFVLSFWNGNLHEIWPRPRPLSLSSELLAPCIRKSLVVSCRSVSWTRLRNQNFDLVQSNAIYFFASRHMCVSLRVLLGASRALRPLMYIAVVVGKRSIAQIFKPSDAPMAINVITDFANRADSLVTVPFGFGGAAFVPDKVTDFLQFEAARSRLHRRAVSDAA